MNWAEERFVKVFTRDTPTWLAWPWQARAVAPLLMRKLEADGRLAVGRLGPTRAVALVIGLPEEVVEIGLAAMLDDGTLQQTDDGIWWPKLEEAQQSRTSDAQRARAYRARQRGESSTPTRHAPSHDVTPHHTASHPVTPRLDKTRLDKTREKLAGKKPPAAAPTADPRHAPLVATLTATFQRVTTAKYPFTGRDAKAVSQLLALAIEPTIDATWAKALASSGYPLVRTLPELVTHFAHFVGATGPPGTRRDEPTTPRPEGRVLL